MSRLNGLKGKTALITGGSAGIGRASAILLAREGARVAITARNEERSREVVREIDEAGGEATFMISDVRFADQCRAAVDETLERYGRIDILFNNAGVFYPRTVPDCSENEWDLTIDTSLKGAFLMSKYALPSMIERGSGVIIHCSSGWGIQGGAQAAAYCAAKGGLVVMTKAMAIDHGPQGIRVNCICPVDVDTPMLPDDAKQRRGGLLAVAHRYFSPPEVEALRALPENEQLDRFFLYWTLKESYIKARGMGLAIPLSQFSFAIASDISIAFAPKLDDDPDSWQFTAMSFGRRHALAASMRRGAQEDVRLILHETVPLA